MALPDTDTDWLEALYPQQVKEAATLKTYDDEYRGTATRAYMHPELAAAIGDRVQQVVMYWPQLVVDAVEERLDPEGFRLPDTDSADDDLWRVWQANNLDEEAQMGRLDALVMRRSYLCVGSNEVDAKTPLVTAESPREVYAYLDPRTRAPLAALRVYTDAGDIVAEQHKYATLYLPNSTTHFDDGAPAGTRGGWRIVERDEHNLGQVPVVPVINRGRLADRLGRSELEPILPLSRAASKLATDLMVGAEFMALPLRGLFGVGPEDLEDADGNQLTGLQVLLGRLLAIPDDEGKAKNFEFSSADLTNFHGSINALAALVAAQAGLPPHYLGLTTTNPASADAIRSAESRLVKRAERKQVAFGGAYEQAMRLVRRLQTGEWEPKYRRLETLWRDAATPTVAQRADASVKLRAERITSLRQTREDLGYTDGQIRRMEADDAQEAAADPVAQIARDFAATPPAAPQPAAPEGAGQ